MSANKEFVCRLAHIECSCGTKVNYLNAPKDHGIRLASGEPLLNENDHEPGTNKNIVHFGQCKSSTNPGNSGIVSSLVNVISLIPGTVGETADDVGKAIYGVFGCKCNPKTFTPWEEIEDDEEDNNSDNRKHIVEGVPVLTTKHQLTCMYGGIITITDKEIE